MALEQRSRNQVRKTNSTAETRRAQRKTGFGAPAESCSKCAVLRICTAMVFLALVFMPLLTELVCSRKGSCYRHGAASGALPPGQCAISPKSAKHPLSNLAGSPHSWSSGGSALGSGAHNEQGLWSPIARTWHQTVPRAPPELHRCLAVVPPLPIRRYYGEAPVGPWRYERARGDANSTHTTEKR